MRENDIWSVLSYSQPWSWRRPCHRTGLPRFSWPVHYTLLFLWMDSKPFYDLLTLTCWYLELCWSPGHYMSHVTGGCHQPGQLVTWHLVSVCCYKWCRTFNCYMVNSWCNLKRCKLNAVIKYYYIITYLLTTKHYNKTIMYLVTGNSGRLVTTQLILYWLSKSLWLSSLPLPHNQ